LAFKKPKEEDEDELLAQSIIIIPIATNIIEKIE
jgi:hypothetical protein